MEFRRCDRGEGVLNHYARLMSPERVIRYADSGDVQIAYQVIGNGPRDIVNVFEWASNLDLPSN